MFERLFKKREKKGSIFILKAVFLIQFLSGKNNQNEGEKYGK